MDEGDDYGCCECIALMMLVSCMPLIKQTLADATDDMSRHARLQQEKQTEATLNQVLG